jgi:hypothetical protein
MTTKVADNLKSPLSDTEEVEIVVVVATSARWSETHSAQSTVLGNICENFISDNHERTIRNTTQFLLSHTPKRERLGTSAGDFNMLMLCALCGAKNIEQV